MSAPSPGRSVYKVHQQDEGFVDIIRGILRNDACSRVPSRDVKNSQEECYKYLTGEIARLKGQCIKKHEEAKEEMKYKQVTNFTVVFICKIEFYHLENATLRLSLREFV